MSSKHLPPYLAMLAVDVKDFSSRPGRHHAGLTERIPGILRTAFVRAGIGEAWDTELRFHRSDGDGYVVGLPAALLPFLTNPVLHALEAVLAEFDDDAAFPGRAPVRMRVSVHVGPVTADGESPVTDGSGTARIELHRLLDSDAVRQVLDRSAPGTHVAAIVSTRAFEDAVLTGHSGDGPGYYARTWVEVKQFRGDAYLRVPNPTGELLQNGIWPAEDSEPAAASPTAPAPAPAASTVIGTAHGPVVSGTGNMYLGDPQP